MSLIRSGFVAIILATPLVLSAQRPVSSFVVEETTIAEIHAAMKAGRLTCAGLVGAYLRRIDAFDRKGAALNAIVEINANAARGG